MFTGLCLSLFTAFALADDSAGDLHAKVLVRKRLTSTTEFLAEEQNLTISLDVMNIGQGPAYSVSVSDNNWDFKQYEIFGQAETYFDVIESGQSFQYNYTVLPHTSGVLLPNSAAYSYQLEPDGPAQFGKSSSMEVHILSKEQKRQMTTFFRTEWSLFTGLSLLSIVFPFINWYNLQQTTEHGLPKETKSK